MHVFYNFLFSGYVGADSSFESVANFQNNRADNLQKFMMYKTDFYCQYDSSVLIITVKFLEQQK